MTEYQIKHEKKILSLLQTATIANLSKEQCRATVVYLKYSMQLVEAGKIDPSETMSNEQMKTFKDIINKIGEDKFKFDISDRHEFIGELIRIEEIQKEQEEIYIKASGELREFFKHNPPPQEFINEFKEIIEEYLQNDK